MSMNSLKLAEVDPVTEAQWRGVFACKFVPDESTRREFNLVDGRKFHCKIARQSYLPMITPSVVEHYFDNPESVALLRISYELVVPAPGGAEALPQAIACPEYYPLGVLVDSMLGKREDYGVTSFQFRVTGGMPDNANVLAFPVRDADRGLFLQLHQQQKSACVAAFGSNAPMMKLEPRMMHQLDDGVRHNDPRAFYYPRALIFQTGQQDLLRTGSSTLLSADIAVFVFHKDGAHISRVVSARACPTLGHVLRSCVACFEDLEDSAINNQVADSAKFASVLVTGVEPSLCTPTDFLRDSMACPDFAVHVTVLQAATSTKKRTILSQVDWRAVAKANQGSPLLLDGA